MAIGVHFSVEIMANINEKAYNVRCKPSLLKSYHHGIVSKAEGEIDQKAEVYIQARCMLTKNINDLYIYSYITCVVINCMTVLHELASHAVQLCA